MQHTALLRISTSLCILSLIIILKLNSTTHSALHTPEEDPKHSESAIQHFHDKLLHIRERLKTEPGKLLAEKRHRLVSP